MLVPVFTGPQDTSLSVEILKLGYLRRALSLRQSILLLSLKT